MKRILPVFLALALILSGFAGAVEGTGFADGSEGAAPISAMFSNGSLSWTIYPGELTGQGLVVAATYDADGRMLDVKTTHVADLSVQRGETVTLWAEDGGTYRVFLLDPSTHVPLMKGLRGDTAITAGPEPGPTPTPDEEEAKLEVVVGDTVFTATFADTQAAREFAQMLPMTVHMSELNGNEKYYYMDDRLTTASIRPGTIETGDLMLYGSDCLVLFYESFSSSYSYTRLGKLDDPSALAAAVGGGNVEVTFRLAMAEQKL